MAGSPKQRRTHGKQRRTHGANPSAGFVLLACALTMFPPVTGDIYLPALPQLTAELGGTASRGSSR